MSRGEAAVAPFWFDDEEWGGYVDEVALVRTVSDGQIDNIVRGFELDGPDGPCDEDSPPRTGFDEQQYCMLGNVVCASPPGPGGPCDENNDIWEEAVPFRQTASDQIVTNVVSTVVPGGP